MQQQINTQYKPNIRQVLANVYRLIDIHPDLSITQKGGQDV